MTKKKKLNEGITLMAHPQAVGGLMGMLPKRVDNFKFKGLPGQFDENGNKILDEWGQPIKEDKEEKIIEGYTKNQLDGVDINSETISVQIVDYDGNKTKYLGMNNKKDIDELITFLSNRKKLL